MWMRELMLVAFPVELVASQVCSGRGYFRCAIGGVDGDDYQWLYAGVTFPDQGGARLKVKVKVTDGSDLEGGIAGGYGQGVIDKHRIQLLYGRRAIICLPIRIRIGEIASRIWKVCGLGLGAYRAKGEELVGGFEGVGPLVVVAIGQVGGIRDGVVHHPVTDDAIDRYVVVKGTGGTLFEVDRRTTLTGDYASAGVYEGTVVHYDIGLGSAD